MFLEQERGVRMALTAVFAVPHPPLLIPEIGLGEENEIRDTLDSMQRVAKRIAELQPDTIIVISPHAPHMSDRFVISSDRSLYGDMRRFHAPSVFIRKNVDLELSTKIYTESLRKSLPVLLSEGSDYYIDHGVLVPLYFIEKKHHDYQLVIISLSDLSYDDHFSLGRCIARACESHDSKTVLIASGDLSHRLIASGPYGFAKEGPLFDQIVTDLMRNSETEEIRKIDPQISIPAGECGLRSLIIMSGALSVIGFSSRFLSYEGPFGVGYAVCEFLPESIIEKSDLSEKKNKDSPFLHEETDPFVALAQAALDEYVNNGHVISVPANLPDELIKEHAGVFVSIKKGGQLRGCIGTIAPVTESIAEEIIRNAIESGTADPRFPPVRAEELQHLVFSVDVLGPPSPVVDRSELDPSRYGVIVSYRGRRGLLLPSLDGVDTVKDQLSIALSKAGIPPDVDYFVEKFEVTRHK